MPTEINLDIGVIQSVDIPTMSEMSEAEYVEYILNDNLFRLDHHDIIRCGKTGRPFATSVQQVDLLIEYLSNERMKMKDFTEFKSRTGQI